MPILNNIANAFLGATQVSAIYRGAEKIWPSFTGLLDLYPNAAVAYSLRRLRADYTGSAIRVRRSSDNAEQDIGFVSNVLDTASLLTFVGAGDGFVTTWYDQSGLGLNATQTVAGVQPEIVLGGVLWEQNGKPAVRFLDDSTGAVLDRLDVPLYHTASQAFVSGFFVHSLEIDGSFPYLMGVPSGDLGFESLYSTSNRLLRPATIRTGGTRGLSGAQVALQTLLIRTDTANRSLLRAYTNGVLRSSGADLNENFNMPTNYTMGNGGFVVILADLLISEAVFYTYDITADIPNISDNMNDFYGAY
jgi:hypothetical protein